LVWGDNSYTVLRLMGEANDEKNRALPPGLPTNGGTKQEEAITAPGRKGGERQGYEKKNPKKQRKLETAGGPHHWGQQKKKK